LYKGGVEEITSQILMKKKISLIFLSALVLISCTNEPAKKVKTVTPNGDYKT